MSHVDLVRQYEHVCKRPDVNEYSENDSIRCSICSQIWVCVVAEPWRYWEKLTRSHRKARRLLKLKGYL